MAATSDNFTPFIPGNKALDDSGLPDLAMSMVRADAKLAGHLEDVTKETIRQYMNDNRVPAISGGIKEVAALVLYHAFINGELERPMAYELSSMPDRSARRLFAQLKDEGLLTETSPRSPLRWAIPEHAEPWYFPQLVPGRI